MMDGTMGGWGLLMMLLMVSVLVLAVVGGVYVYRRLSGPQVASIAPSRSEDDAALRRLRERYAAGEIDEPEFERRLSALTHWR